MIVTYALIGITALVSWYAFSHPRLLGQLLMWPPAVSRGREYWRMFSYGFVHADWQHLLFNMITLYFFGGAMARLIEARLGPLGFLGFYLFALPFSILPSYLRHRNDPNYRSLGASGAVSAVLFAYILVDPWSMLLVFFVPMPAIVFAAIYVGYTIWAEHARRDNINHSAHLWGAAYGVLFLIAMEPRVVGHFLGELSQPRFGP
ncbi:MAG TPA: rhomboid family intramembrane serine protease [Xanthomonadaceae bacterium]|nr:rhomboid family intramembrane serine protease [Xanthomonadaceae bacterium]